MKYEENHVQFFVKGTQICAAGNQNIIIENTSKACLSVISWKTEKRNFNPYQRLYQRARIIVGEEQIGLKQ